MGYKSKDKQRAYQRKWMADRRAAFFAGKCCVYCGCTKNLELDHIDQTTKVSHRIWSWSAERQAAEIAKCQVLCRDCHLSKSVKDNRGDFRVNSKLTEEDIKSIRLRLDNGETQQSIADSYNVHRTAISKIKNNRIWKHI